MKIFSLITISIIILIFTIISLIFIFKKSEKYQPIEGQPDDHFLYVIFPDLDNSSLSKFARTSPESSRLVKKYLRTLGIRLNPKVIDELLFFVENPTKIGGIKTDYLQSEFLLNLFNIIRPNSSKIISIRDKPILTLNTDILPVSIYNFTNDPATTDNIIRREINPGTNLKVIIKCFRDNNKFIMPNFFIFIRKNTNEDIENMLMQLFREIQNTELFISLRTILLAQNGDFIRTDPPFNQMTGEQIRRTKNSPNTAGLLFMFTLSALNIFDMNNNFDEIVPPEIRIEEIDEEKE